MKLMRLFSKNETKNVLVLGCNGMLGGEATEYFRAKAAAMGGGIGIVTGLDYPGVDIASAESLERILSVSIHYDYIINCAAVTDTRRIETDLKIPSYEINALACRNLAKACLKYGSKLIHISTDYVFSELSGKGPFSFDGQPVPVNTYGLHKLLGEQFIRTEMPFGEYAIVRVSWLYGKYNEKSFIHKFLRNCAAKMNDGVFEIPCTDDEYSAPTSCSNLCVRLYVIVKSGLSGILHGNDLVTENGGKISRLEFCEEILSNLKSMYTGESGIQNLRCVGTHMSDSGVMRYPKDSAMVPSSLKSPEAGSFPIICNGWKSALNSFMRYDSDVRKWITGVFGEMRENDVELPT